MCISYVSSRLDEAREVFTFNWRESPFGIGARISNQGGARLVIARLPDRCPARGAFRTRRDNVLLSLAAQGRDQMLKIEPFDRGLIPGGLSAQVLYSPVFRP